jgi:hypothetical protein
MRYPAIKLDGVGEAVEYVFYTLVGQCFVHLDKLGGLHHVGMENDGELARGVLFHRVSPRLGGSVQGY